MCCRHSEVRSFYPLTLVALLRRRKGARQCCRSQRAGGFIQQQRASTLTGLFFKLGGGVTGEYEDVCHEMSSKFKANFSEFTLKMEKLVGLLAFTRWPGFSLFCFGLVCKYGFYEAKNCTFFLKTLLLKTPLPDSSLLVGKANVTAVNHTCRLTT